MKIVAAFLLCLACALGLRGQAALGVPVRADIVLPEKGALVAPGQSIEEIGSSLGLSGNATKHSIFRAVQKLRRALEPLVNSAGVS